mmetsp:Transcript_24338/g.91925  ORF Transcript_24338/g.91925 Transcript_24338/m.91925 type:complete len:81 (+) Transcript_24338:518-760(+)
MWSLAPQTVLLATEPSVQGYLDACGATTVEAALDAGDAPLPAAGPACMFPCEAAARPMPERPGGAARGGEQNPPGAVADG